MMLAATWTRALRWKVGKRLLECLLGGGALGEMIQGRKLAEHPLGGACLHLLVELRALSSSGDVTFQLHDLAADRVLSAAGTIDLVVGEQSLRLDLTSLAARKRE